MLQKIRKVPFWAFGWLLLTVGIITIRPALPVDESRYLAVAWEMWLRHSIWVPYLNGDFYDGKPPLFFWLMEAGWALFGVSEWWARIVAPLFGMGALVLTTRIAKLLWNKPQIGGLAPTILLGSIYWALFSSSTMFDMLLSTFVLLAIYGLVRVWKNGSMWNFGLTGIALGLGILAKGPVVFLPVASIALLAPWWMENNRPEGLSWGRWYKGLLASAGIAGAIALVWLIPMTLYGGKDYLLDMTVHQTAGYVVHSFSHLRPWWWYLPVLPLMLFPWTFCPTAWRGFGRLRYLSIDPGSRLCIAWFVPVLMAFSFISGKQPHYLLPTFPAFALLLARLLTEPDQSASTPSPYWDLLPSILLTIIGIVLIVVPLAVPSLISTKPIAAHALQITMERSGVVLVILGLLPAVFINKLALEGKIKLLAGTAWFALLLASWGLFQSGWPAQDLRVPSAFVGDLERAGKPLAIVGPYAGEFNFYGRLKAPIKVLGGSQILEWAQHHPDGYVIFPLSSKNWPPPTEPKPAYKNVYRGGGLAIWRSADVASLQNITPLND